jgi:F0F1-type ATP synthase gamma subunit
MGLKVKLVLVGNKGKQYFQRRPQYEIVSECRAAREFGWARQQQQRQQQQVLNQAVGCSQKYNSSS